MQGVIQIYIFLLVCFGTVAAGQRSKFWDRYSAMKEYTLPHVCGKPIKKEINVFTFRFCTFVWPFPIGIYWGRGGWERKNVMGEGSLVLLIGPSSRSLTNCKEMLNHYDKKGRKSAMSGSFSYQPSPHPLERWGSRYYDKKNIKGINVLNTAGIFIFSSYKSGSITLKCELLDQFGTAIRFQAVARELVPVNVAV